jgi:hypothetical protein
MLLEFLHSVVHVFVTSKGGGAKFPNAVARFGTQVPRSPSNHNREHERPPVPPSNNHATTLPGRSLERGVHGIAQHPLPCASFTPRHVAPTRSPSLSPSGGQPLP